MKSKKLFAGLMTAAMLSAAVVMPAAAASEGAIDLTKTLQSDQAQAAPDVTFDFLISSDTSVVDGTVDQGSGYKIYQGITAGIVDNSSVTFDSTQDQFTGNGTIVKTQTNAFDFSQVQFTEPGIYRYLVKEDEANVLEPFSADSSTYVVDVYVAYNQGGALEVERAVTYKQGEPLNQATKKTLGFTNKMDTDSLTLKKTVTGNLGDQTQQFVFSVTLKSSDALPSGTQLNGQIIRAAGGVEPVQMTVDDESIYMLAHGDSLVFTGIPSGTTYTVAEINEDGTEIDNNETKDGYTVNVIDSDNGTVNSDGMNNGAEIEIVNTKNGTTPTGVAMRIAPFVLAGIAGAAFVLTSRKKKENA